MTINPATIFEYPITISWEITEKCNYQCIHCRMDDCSEYDNTRELSKAEIFDILEQLQDIGVQQINFSGGEPFCRSDFIDILQMADNLGINTGITTNGSLLDLEMISKMSRLKNLKLVQVSLDGSQKELHDFIRGKKGAYNHAINALIELKSAGIRAGAVTTIMTYNKDNVDNILKLLLDLHIDTYGARRFMPVGRGSTYINSLKVSKEDYKNHCKRWIEYVNKYSDKIQLYIEEPLIGILKEQLKSEWLFSGCIGGSIYGAIMSNGDVRPCIFLPLSLGNLRENSFKDIWVKNPLRAQFIERNDIEECGKCDKKNVCGGCRAMAFAESGNIKSKDPLCFRV